ncbi:hypothetical protein TNIN_356861 [Trichonephila inaurata madagascariensis]|uniref:PiggyBac transposable element-derived protein domain-containing protein n=1 Tax=Trichonephila inaurata madagascariensis TaxID=2747483 RepID=A0A8X6I6T7_9ARAC|nr:hypothetical protein TNIN_356861 [Trichonephila inaurata madagascariensis]
MAQKRKVDYYDDNFDSDTESLSSFESDEDFVPSISSSEDDLSDEEDFSSVRQWCKIDSRGMLLKPKTDFFGTLRPNRKDLPKELKTEKLKKEDLLAYQRGKMMTMRWRDKSQIN